MECAAGYDRVLRSRLGILQLPGVEELSAVHIIADNRVLYIRKMDTYLVGSAGLGVESKQ